MAKVSFDVAVDENNSYNTNNNTTNPGSDVGFFTLKNDGDEAIVRFMDDSTDDFEILAVHNVTVGNKYKKVNCIRTPQEPLSNCPLCESGASISLRFFIRMLQYVPQADGTYVPKAVIWERNTAYAKTLKSYMENYGSLSDMICKVIRHGKAGDTNTTYEIIPNLSKMTYRDDVFVKDTNLFGNFKAEGTFVMNKSHGEISEFLATGSFPQKPTEEVTPRTAPVNEPPVTVPPMNGQPAYNINSTPAYQQHPVDSGAPQYYGTPNQSNPPFAPTNNWASGNTEIARPVRRY